MPALQARVSRGRYAVACLRGVPSLVCAACRIAIDRADQDAHMSTLAAKPLKERVRAIELALYRLDADARLKKLEVANMRY